MDFLGFGTSADGRFFAQIGGDVVGVPTHSSLDSLLAEPRETWLAVIDDLRARHAAGDLERLSFDGPDAIEPALPFTVGDYVDFYSSLEHATFFGRLLRPGDDPVAPNWRRMPVGYHGRSSTVVVSGTPIVRPRGQTPEWAETQALDIEAELGFVIGGSPNPLGEPIPIERASERIFGVVLLNDWSARDIQRYEQRPLGPFLGKAFATSISPLVVPVAALEHARVAGPAQDPDPPAYLLGGGDWNFDIELSVLINGRRAATVNAAGLYWSAAQQLAHLASGGAIVRPGDLLGTGTISGATKDSGGSLLEMGHPFLSDGDTVTIRGRAGEMDLGEVRGRIEPAHRE